MIYDDDRFHPTNNNDIDQNTYINNIILSDTGYNKVIQTYIDENNVKRKYLLEYYSSGGNTKILRNAVTGLQYKNLRIGTKDENLLFKIPINSANNNNRENLFYDSPEQYEIHQHQKLSSKTIQLWYNKKLNKS